MSFFKDNLQKINRMIITHIAMSIFGLSIFLATNQMDKLMLPASIFSVVFYAVIVYTTMWEYGAKDKPAYDAGRKLNAGGTGFKICFFAELFWIVLAIAFAVSSQFDTSLAANVSTVVYFVEFLSSSCFTGIEVFIKNSVLKEGSAIAPLAVSGVYILGSLIISAAGAFGYVLGTKDITIIPKKNKSK